MKQDDINTRLKLAEEELSACVKKVNQKADLLGKIDL